MKPVNACLAIFLVAAVFGGCAKKKELVIEDGVSYTIVSFGSTDTETKEGYSIATYLITFTYTEGEEEVSANTRGTVAVPRSALKVDRTLPVNSIIWDVPQTIEGKTYRTVRWNPRKIEEANTNEPIIEEEPLIRR